MPAECRHVQAELSAAHDEGRALEPASSRHLTDCPECSAFAARLADLDSLLARGSFDGAPDVAPSVTAELTRPRRQWWSVAAVALIGIVVGALIGGLGSRLDVGLARDLHDLLHETGSSLEGLSAELVVVERGVHADVPERVYSGSLHYAAPEQLSIELVDTTSYPTDGWIPNDVRLVIDDGDTLSTAGSPCPVAALPGCLVSPMTRAVRDQPPFDEGVTVPLEIIGPRRSLAQSSAFEILGTPTLGDRPTIQVRSTVAAVELIGALTNRGAWRELHPTDEVVMWLDEETLAPLRLEVFPADSPERELWQIRRGYDDPVDREPIFIVELSDLERGAAPITADLPSDAPSLGFVDTQVDVPTPELPQGFTAHRSGSWQLPDGGRVEVASWSDGRSWLMVEATADWNEPSLFGLTSPFVRPVELGGGSIGYLSPTGDSVAIDTGEQAVVVSGSVPPDLLLDLAATLDLSGRPVPSDWAESANVALEDLPTGTLVPEGEGWSILGRVEGDTTTILLSGGGARNILITQEPGVRLETPIGPDFIAQELRGVTGRFDASSGTLEWVEDGRVIRMASDTVGRDELVDLAETMESP